MKIVALFTSLFLLCSCGVFYKTPSNTKKERAYLWLKQNNDRLQKKKNLEDRLNKHFNEKVLSQISLRLTYIPVYKPIEVWDRFVNNPLELSEKELSRKLELISVGASESVENSSNLALNYKLDESKEESILEGIFLSGENKPQSNSIRSCLYESYIYPGFSLSYDFEFCSKEKFSLLEYWFYKYRYEAIYLSEQKDEDYLADLSEVYEDQKTQTCLNSEFSKGCLGDFKSRLKSIKSRYFSDAAKQAAD